MISSSYKSGRRKLFVKKIENNEFAVNTKWLYEDGRTTDQVADAVGIELRDMVFRAKNIPVDTKDKEKDKDKENSTA